MEIAKRALPTHDPALYSKKNPPIPIKKNGGEIKSSLPKTYDGRAFGYILWLEWEFVNKNSFVGLLRGGRSGIF